jgi:hypothetical protein
MRISRRRFTGTTLGVLTLAASSLGPVRAASEVEEDVSDLKPGQFVWYPERAEAGPMVIIVSLPDQRVYVYRNGIRIGVSTCATGRPGHATPTGVFTILQKDKDHHSSLYHNAPMPFTERLTWSGVALHAGDLPGYPDSHGCVHLPLEFSKLLFGVTQLGTPVIIADATTAPAEVLHPGLLWNEAIERDVESAAANPATGAKETTPAAQSTTSPGAQGTAPSGPLSILISGADRELFALDGGVEVIAAPVTITDPDEPLGTHVFVLAEASGGQERWHAVGIGAPPPDGQADDAATVARNRVQIPADVAKRLHPLLQPGATMMITDMPATADTRSGKDFVILAQAATS